MFTAYSFHYLSLSYAWFPTLRQTVRVSDCDFIANPLVLNLDQFRQSYIPFDAFYLYGNPTFISRFFLNCTNVVILQRLEVRCQENKSLLFSAMFPLLDQGSVLQENVFSCLNHPPSWGQSACAWELIVFAHAH